MVVGCGEGVGGESLGGCEYVRWCVGVGVFVAVVVVLLDYRAPETQSTPFNSYQAYYDGDQLLHKKR